MTKKSGRVCVFCGGRPVTEEHMWPDWLSRSLGKFRNIPFRVRLETEVGQEPRAWRTSRLNLTVRRFCRTCNNTWMSELESQVKPILEPIMLHGQTTVLSPNDQMTLSRWAYKMALVADLVLPRFPIIPEKWYGDFYRERMLREAGLVIWLTAYGGQEKAAHTYRRLLIVWPRKHEMFDRPETYGFLLTFTAFRAVFQVLGYFGGKWKPSLRKSPSDNFLITLWPPTKTPALWPRNQLALSDRRLEQFTARDDFI